MKKYIIIGLLFIVAIFLVMIFSNNNDYIKTGNLYISEILASNSYSYKDNDGNYSDYIELYNGYDYDIDLLGYYLTDKIVDVKKWSFPDITISAHEYLIIYASGKDKCKEKDACHTNFKLSKDKEMVSLIDSGGNIISRVSFNNLPNDISYSLVNGKYIKTIPTPKEENKSVKEEKENYDYKLSINEYMTHNKSSHYIQNGSFYDWVEIYNESNDVNLKNIYIKDNPNNLKKYKLRDEIIKKNEYAIIYLTGNEEIEEMYANFKLSDDDSKIIISDGVKIIDEVDVVKLPDNMSYGKYEGKWYYYYQATPGFSNKKAGLERINNENT